MAKRVAKSAAKWRSARCPAAGKGPAGGLPADTAALQAAQHSPNSLLCVDPLSTAALLGAPPVLPGEQAEIAPGLMLAGLDGPRRAAP